MIRLPHTRDCFKNSSLTPFKNKVNQLNPSVIQAGFVALPGIRSLFNFFRSSSSSLCLHCARWFLYVCDTSSTICWKNDPFFRLRHMSWTDGWADGWMGGRTDGWMDGWMDGRTDGWMRRMNESMNGRMDFRMTKWMTKANPAVTHLEKSHKKKLFQDLHRIVTNREKSLDTYSGKYPLDLKQTSIIFLPI